MQQTIRTGLNRGHCGHSKSLVDIADTVQKEQSHHFTRKVKNVFSALGMEMAQWHPGLESTAEPPGGFSHVKNSWISRVIWESQLSDSAFSCLFVKPPCYSEPGELTAILMALRWSLRNVKIREIKGKITQPQGACAGLNRPAEPCEQSRDKRGSTRTAGLWQQLSTFRHHCLLIRRSPEAVKACTQLCFALENSWLGLFEYELRNQAVT